jgi:putative salt-induced outer membrane protein YdiY
MAREDKRIGANPGRLAPSATLCGVDDTVMASMNHSLRAEFAVAVRYLALFAVAGCLSMSAQAVPVIDYQLDADNTPAPLVDIAASDRSPQLLLAQVPTEPGDGEDWDAARPPADRFDWLQTTSGEWIKGELKAMYSGSLEFDSKKFKLQTLKMEDVAQYLGHGTKRVSIETSTGNRIVNGVVTMNRLRVNVVSDNVTQSFDRKLLISITPSAPTETDNWSGKISFGFNYTRGNTENTDKIGRLLIRRRTPENRLLVNYEGQVSDVNDTETVNNHRTNLLYDVYPERGFFWRPVFLEYYHDPFQNIEHRATLGLGGGYHLLDKPGVTWNISGGPAYREIRYDSVQAGDSDKASTPTLVASTFFDTELTSEIDFTTLYNLSIVNRESGTYTHHARATFSIELTSIIDFDISLVWDRTRDPQPRSDGSVPEQDDIQWLMLLGVDF